MELHLDQAALDKLIKERVDSATKELEDRVKALERIVGEKDQKYEVILSRAKNEIDSTEMSDENENGVVGVNVGGKVSTLCVNVHSHARIRYFIP